LLQHLSVKIFVERNDLAGAVFFLRGGARSFSHSAQGRFITQERDCVTRHGIDVADIGQKTADSVLDHFGNSSRSRSNWNDFAGHAFERGESEGFEFARHQHYVGNRQLFADLVLLAEKQYVLVNTFLYGQPFCLGAIGAVADQQQLGGNLLVHAVEDFDDIENAFYRTKIGKVDQQAFFVGNVLDAFFEPFRLAHILVAVHEVGNDLDVVLDVENLEGAIAQILRDRRDSVALLDGKTRDGKIGAIEADQSDVGAVQRGDERQIAARRGGRQHLLGEHGAHRMRNGVVHVEQVEFVKLRDFGHARRQGQIIGRIFKERIAGDLDFVIMNVGFRSGQANGLRIGDEMNLVAAAGKLKSQFGSNDSAAAVGWITGDADLHVPPEASANDTIIGFAGGPGDAGENKPPSCR